MNNTSQCKDNKTNHLLDRREFILRSAEICAAGFAGTLVGSAAWASNDAPLNLQPVPTHVPPSLRLAAPMRDGVRLATDIWLPEGNGPFPAILVRSCYNYIAISPIELIANQFLQAGYAFVIQFIRGQFGSEGKFIFGGANERNDGYDSVEWVAAQAWCDGNVGMMGTSYLGLTQLYAAATKPPHLKAVSPIAPPGPIFDALPFQGGGFNIDTMLSWSKSLQPDFDGSSTPEDARELYRRLRHRPLIEAADGWLEGPYLEMYKSFLEHPHTDSAFWDQIDHTDADFSNMDVPFFWISGHFDTSTDHVIAAWQKIRHLAPANQHHMLIGPYDHGPIEEIGCQETTRGPYQFGENVLTNNVAIRMPFFDRHLKGMDTAADLPDRVRVYITGSNVWRDFSDMPVPGADARTLYLSSHGRAQGGDGDGVASFEPGSPVASDQVLVDPDNPVKGHYMGFETHIADREDVLVYTSAPLEQPLTIIGQPEVTLYVGCDTPDADVVIDLNEVRADGVSVKMAKTMRRLRYRNGLGKEAEMMTPGKPEQVNLQMDWIGHTFPPGSRLQVIIAGTVFGMMDTNPNTGEPIATATRTQRTRLHIIHTDAMPSRVRLPMVNLEVLT